MYSARGDVGIRPLTNSEKHDLREIVEDRHGLHSTIATSQIPVERWHEHLGEPTVAAVIVDRFLCASHRLELTGENLRREPRPLNGAAKEKAPPFDSKEETLNK